MMIIDTHRPYRWSAMTLLPGFLFPYFDGVAGTPPLAPILPVAAGGGPRWTTYPAVEAPKGDG